LSNTGAVVEQLVILEHDADALAERGIRRRFTRARVLAVDEHGAARRLLDQRDELQQRALAGARGARQERHLAALELRS
jgi:hypothetical protein